MKYHKQKFNLNQKSLLTSRLFDVMNGTKKEVLANDNNENEDQKIVEEEVKDEEWRQKLKEKENQLAAHFSKMLKNYKPSILV